MRGYGGKSPETRQSRPTLPAMTNPLETPPGTGIAPAAQPSKPAAQPTYSALQQNTRNNR
jgi:hypothetical protein